MEEKHNHPEYKIEVKETVIVRWCPECGKTWIIVRYAQGGVFDARWTEVAERER